MYKKWLIIDEYENLRLSGLFVVSVSQSNRALNRLWPVTTFGFLIRHKGHKIPLNMLHNKKSEKQSMSMAYTGYIAPSISARLVALHECERQSVCRWRYRKLDRGSWLRCGTARADWSLLVVHVCLPQERRPTQFTSRERTPFTLNIIEDVDAHWQAELGRFPVNTNGDFSSFYLSSLHSPQYIWVIYTESDNKFLWGGLWVCQNPLTGPAHRWALDSLYSNLSQ